MSNFEYKLIPIDRRTGIPAFKPEDVKPQITIDLDEFHRVMRRVNPPEGLSALVIDDERDKELMSGTLASAISEMFGGEFSVAGGLI